jgi:hypothetical protein
MANEQGMTKVLDDETLKKLREMIETVKVKDTTRLEKLACCDNDELKFKPTEFGGK